MVFAGDTTSGATASAALRLSIQVLRGRWFMLYASLLIMSAAGATYIFGVYSKDIKSSLHYDQQTLNTLSFFKDLGANVGILSGLINEVTPPWVVLSIGAAVNFAGYFMIYLSITGRVSRPAVWQMCLYICAGANSQTFANTGALVTAVKNFPESRGIVLGLLKGFVGLSGAIITQLYLAFYGDDSKTLVLLIAWLPAAISIVFVYTIRIIPIPNGRKIPSKPFFCFLYISLALAGYLMLMIIIEKRLQFSHPEYSASVAVVLLLLFLPIGVVVKEEFRAWSSQRNEVSLHNVIIGGAAATAAAPPAPPARRWWNDVLSPPARGEDYSILQALFSLDMAVLFFATICGVGGTLTAIDNMGQIGESLGYPSRSISTFVSLISIWNYAGRVVAGFASEMVMKKYRLPRPLMLTGVLLLSCVGHLLIAFGVEDSLYLSSVIIGFTFGAQWPLLFAIISEVFGLKYYSTLYNFGGVASPIGSYILNVRVAGRLYDREAERQNGGGTCMGVVCYKMAFLIITGVTVAGAVVSVVLVWRTREFYRGDIYAKFREVEIGGGGDQKEKEKEKQEENNDGGN